MPAPCAPGRPGKPLSVSVGQLRGLDVRSPIPILRSLPAKSGRGTMKEAPRNPPARLSAGRRIGQARVPSFGRRHGNVPIFAPAHLLTFPPSHVPTVPPSHVVSARRSKTIPTYPTARSVYLSCITSALVVYSSTLPDVAPSALAALVAAAMAPAPHAL